MYEPLGYFVQSAQTEAPMITTGVPISGCGGALRVSACIEGLPLILLIGTLEIGTENV